jgi:ATP-dependent Lon protease
VGQFSIFSAKTIDEGIEILTGTKAGVREGDGAFEENSVNYFVDRQLKNMADKLKEFPLYELQKRAEN